MGMGMGMGTEMEYLTEFWESNIITNSNSNSTFACLNVDGARDGYEDGDGDGIAG